MEAEGAVTGAIPSAPYRCCDCGVRITAGRNSVTKGDRVPGTHAEHNVPGGTENGPIDRYGEKAVPAQEPGTCGED